MKSGDILLFKAENDLISRMIAWGTDSKYSHVAVCVSPELDLAIEAITRGGVRARSVSGISSSYDVYRVKKEYDYDLGMCLAYLVKQLNNGYDYKGVLWLGILKLASKFKKNISETANRWQKERDYFCSELCYEAFDFGGLDIVPDVPLSAVTSPGDIARSRLLHIVNN